MTDTTLRPEARPDKVATVAEMAAAFRDSSAALVTEYRGLTMAQITTLRRALGQETTYAVVKNTLTKRAAADAGLTIDEGLFAGPTAIAFVGGDPVAAAKSVRDFSRTNPLLVIKGAVLDGKFLSADDVRKLADLESREVLLARLAGAMVASLSQAAALFQAPLAQLARAGAALQEKRAAEPQAASSPAEPVPDAAGSDAAGADGAPADVPVPDATEVPGDPAADATVAETSAAETPVAEAPVAEAAVADVPVADVPVADVPVADAPGADAPGADAPGAGTPADETPAAEPPTAQTPAAEAPRTQG